MECRCSALVLSLTHLCQARSLCSRMTSTWFWQRFSVNFMDAADNILFHFNPRSSQDTVVRNSRLDGAWGTEERAGGLPLTPGGAVRLTVTRTADGYSVAVDGTPFTFYADRVATPVARVETSLDDATASLTQGTPLSLPHALPDGLRIGQSLRLTGQWDNQAINLRDAAGNILFHFNPRPEEGAVVRNSQLDGAWGAEERDGGWPFRADTAATIEIERIPSGYAVYVNGVLFTTYKSRSTAPDARAETSAEVTAATLSSDPVVSIEQTAGTAQEIVESAATVDSIPGTIDGSTDDLCDYTGFQFGPDFVVYRHDDANTLCDVSAESADTSVACKDIPIMDPDECLALCLARSSGPSCRAFYTYYDMETYSSFCQLLKSRATLSGPEYGDGSRILDQFSGIPTGECQDAIDSMWGMRSKRVRHLLHSFRSTSATPLFVVVPCVLLVVAVVAYKRHQKGSTKPTTTGDELVVNLI
eukprot:TRINITY_DN10618_c0_g1_i2.p1 TRINITY_DN10618_c0_g1~~TRINITY_DN10618_c0_g1_i2.p1  ORF type:complete len:474 (-),score=115.81 TRINITY_DN10618_c0_g1_i2:75-1496(-)